MGLIAKGKYDEGVKELEKANEIAPHPDVLFNIARAYAEGGNLEKAIGAYKEYLATGPKDEKQVETIVADCRRVSTRRRPSEGERACESEARRGRADAPSEAAPPEPEPAAKAAPSNIGITSARRARRGRLPGDRRHRVARRAEPARLAELDDHHHEAGHPALGHHAHPRAAPPRRRDGRDADHGRRRQRLDARLQQPARRTSSSSSSTGGSSTTTSSARRSGRRSRSTSIKIERIEVVRGPGSALYGADAFAGVVNIITIAPGEGKPGVRVGYGDDGKRYGSAWVTGRDGDFAYRASVGYTRYPRWTREVAPGRVDITFTDFDQNLGAHNLRADLRGSRRIGKDSEVYLGGGLRAERPRRLRHRPLQRLLASSRQPRRHRRLQEQARQRARLLDAPQRDTRRPTPLISATRSTETAPLQNSVDAEVEYKDNFKFPEALRHDIHVGLGYRLKNIQWSYLQSDIPAENHGSAYIAGHDQDRQIDRSRRLRARRLRALSAADHRLAARLAHRQADRPTSDSLLRIDRVPTRRRSSSRISTSPIQLPAAGRRDHLELARNFGHEPRSSRSTSPRPRSAI